MIGWAFFQSGLAKYLSYCQFICLILELAWISLVSRTYEFNGSLIQPTMTITIVRRGQHKSHNVLKTLNWLNITFPTVWKLWPISVITVIAHNRLDAVAYIYVLFISMSTQHDNCLPLMPWTSMFLKYVDKCNNWPLHYIRTTQSLVVEYSIVKFDHGVILVKTNLRHCKLT